VSKRITSDLSWDPYDVDLDTDPHPTWKRMRDEQPVYWNDRFGFFALARHADVEAAHRMPRELSSAYGTVLERMSSPGQRGDDVKRLIVMDPPEHDRLRALVSRAFTIRRVAELEPEVRRICTDLLDARAGRDGFDYLTDFGSIVPSEVISALLGVPEADRAAARDLVDRVFHIEPGVGMINDTSIGAAIALHAYLADQLAERRRSPRDDMMTALVEATIDEDGETRRLTDDEAIWFAHLLVAAGTETTARLLGWAVVLLDQHPEQRDMLADDPGAIPRAIEEVLRYEAPSPVQGRTATRDLEFHGTTIPEGSKVLLLTGSAGRDGRAHPDPDRFDIRRSSTAHVSFGHGVHYCIGAALARLEARVALEETFKRFPSWHVDYDRAERIHTSTVRGWSRVPITS
jgi:cytochrome P450